MPRVKNTICTTLVALLLVSKFVSGQVVWHVDDNQCPTLGTGTQTDPFCKILDAVIASDDGDTIRVAPGMYVEHVNFLGRAVTVVAVGGPESTTIQGDPDGRVVIFSNGEGTNSVLEGFTITDGVGGIVCENSSPTIHDCVIINNSAEAGAGILCINGSPTVSKCRIQGNHAGNIGGGIICRGECSPIFANCTVAGNTAQHGGGMYFFDDAAPFLRRCTFIENTAFVDPVLETGGSGGAVVAAGGNAFFDGCTFRQNRSEAGAGMSCAANTPVIASSKFQANHATQIGGGLLANGCAPRVISSLFIDNSAGYGGGAVYNYSGGDTILTNCTIVGNTAVHGPGVWAGNHSHSVVYNSIVWDNGLSPIYTDDTSTIIVTYSDVQYGSDGIENIAANPLFRGATDYRLSAGSPCIDRGKNSSFPTYVTTDFDGLPRFADDPYTVDHGLGTPPIIDIGACEHRDCNENGTPDQTDVRECMNEPWCADVNGNGVPDPCETVGDLNLDGAVDLADAALLAACLAGPAEEFPPFACPSWFAFRTADLNTNGHVDLSDAAACIRAYPVR